MGFPRPAIHHRQRVRLEMGCGMQCWKGWLCGEMQQGRLGSCTSDLLGEGKSPSRELPGLGSTGTEDKGH